MGDFEPDQTPGVAEGTPADPRTGGPAPRTVRAVLLATMALGTVAWVMGGRPLFPTLWAGLLLIYFPILSLVTPTEGLELGPKAALYRGTAIVLAILGALSAWAMGWPRPTGVYAGLLTFPAWGDLLQHTALLLSGCLLVMGAFHALGRALGWRERPLVRWLMPDGPREKGGFVVLSAAAGLGEEVAYRGFAPAYLAFWTGSYWTGAIPAAIAFGCLHMYQGVHGIVRTAAIGLVLALGVGLTGNVWSAAVAHALLNVLVGLALKDILLGGPEDATPHASHPFPQSETP